VPGAVEESNIGFVARPRLDVGPDGDPLPDQYNAMSGAEAVRAVADTQGAGAWSMPVLPSNPAREGAIYFSGGVNATVCCPETFSLTSLTATVAFLDGPCEFFLGQQFVCPASSLPVPALDFQENNFLSDPFIFHGIPCRLSIGCDTGAVPYFAASFVTADLQTMVIDWVSSGYYPCGGETGRIVFFDPDPFTFPHCQIELEFAP